MIIVTEIVRSDVRMLLAIISIIPDLTPNRKKKKNKKKKKNTGRWRKRVNLFFAINISPRQTHSSFRRQVLSGRLKSQAVQISSVTIDGGCN
jgi:hypothetical protein